MGFVRIEVEFEAALTPRLARALLQASIAQVVSEGPSLLFQSLCFLYQPLGRMLQLDWCHGAEP